MRRQWKIDEVTDFACLTVKWVNREVEVVPCRPHST